MEKANAEALACRWTVKDLFCLIVEDYAANERKSSDTLLVNIQHLERYFADKLAETLSTSDVEAYKVIRKKEGAAPTTVNLELAALSRAYTLALEREYVTRKPKISKYKIGKSRRRRGYFTDNQQAVLLEALPDWMQPILRLGDICGWREGELFGLRWDENYDAESQALVLEDSKNGDGRTLPLLDRSGTPTEAYEIIQERLKQRLPHCPYIFFNPNQKDKGKPISRTVFHKMWSVACKATGVQRLFHDLRRTTVRRLTRALVPRPIAKKITGHKTDWVYDWYDIVDLDDVKVGLANAADYKKQQSPQGNPAPAPTPATTREFDATEEEEVFMNAEFYASGLATRGAK